MNSLAELVEGMVVEGGGLGHHEYLCQYKTDRQRHNLATLVGVDCLQKLYQGEVTHPTQPSKTPTCRDVLSSNVGP